MAGLAPPINQNKSVTDYTNEFVNYLYNFDASLSQRGKQFILYFFVYAIIITATLVYFNFSNINKGFSFSTFIYAVIAVVLLLVLGVFIYPSMRTGNMNNVIVIASITIIILTTIGSYFYTSMSNKQIQSTSYFLFIIVSLMGIVGLAYLFYKYGSYLKQQRGILGFIINFIFYIPCLLLDFIQYIKNEFNITTRITYILLGIEAALLIGYYAIPELANRYLFKSGIHLLEGSAFLNKKKILATGELLQMPQTDESLLQNNPVQFRQNFSISLWVYLNAQQNNYSVDNNELTIFDYGSKPKITYFNDITNEDGKDKYKIFFTKSQNQYAYEISLPKQKWNNFVFNYKSNMVDLFVNGDLVKSFEFSKNDDIIPQYVISDEVSIGSKNGPNGAICNIVYNEQPLSKEHIVTSYNLLMTRNPPIYKI